MLARSESKAADIKLQYVADIISPFINSSTRRRKIQVIHTDEDSSDSDLDSDSNPNHDIYEAEDDYNLATKISRGAKKRAIKNKRRKKIFKEVEYEAVDLSTGEELLIAKEYVYKTWFNRNIFHLCFRDDDDDASIYNDISCIHGTSITILTQLLCMSQEELADVLATEYTFQSIGRLIRLLYPCNHTYEVRSSKITRRQDEYITKRQDEHITKPANIIFDRKLYRIIADPVISNWFHPQAISLFRIRLQSFLDQLISTSIPDNIVTITNISSIALNTYTYKLNCTWSKYLKKIKYIASGKYVMDQLKRLRSMKYIEDISNDLYKKSDTIRNFIIEFSSAGKQSIYLNNVKSNSLFEPRLLESIFQFLDISSLIPDNKSVKDWITSNIKLFKFSTDIETNYKSYKNCRKSHRISFASFKLLAHSLDMPSYPNNFYDEEDI
jgi:hypothetical protein